MLITKESSTKLAEERRRSSDDLAGHVGSVLRELNSVRTETKRLLDQRRQLEVYLTALKTELEGLRAEKVELMALRAQVLPHASTAAEVDLVARARAAAGASTSKSATPTPPQHREEISHWAPRDGTTDEDAFKAFISAEEDHDKSREWFMSQSH